MAIVTNEGIIPTSLEEYVGELERVFQGVFGENLDLSPETPQGQIIGNLALKFSELDDALVRLSGASDINRAYAHQLDGLANALGVIRKDAQRSVVNVEVGGIPATLIPAGSRAKTESDDMYQFDSDVRIGDNGKASAVMYSVEVGAVPIEAGDLESIVDLVSGWETVTNATPSELGANIETDTQYRNRFKAQVNKNAVTPLGAVLGAIREIEGVKNAVGRENDNGKAVIFQDVELPPHSIYIVAQGGGDKEIAQAIYTKKTGGVATYGAKNITLRDVEGFDVDIKFDRPNAIDIEIDLTISLNANFPDNGVADIKQRIFDYITGNHDRTESLWFYGGLRIGQPLSKYRLLTPINDITGHDIVSFDLRIKGEDRSLESVSARLNDIITINSLDDITITIEA